MSFINNKIELTELEIACGVAAVLGLFLFGVVMCLPGLYAEIVPGITKLFEQR